MTAQGHICTSLNTESLWLVVCDFKYSVHGNNIALVNNFNGWPTDNHNYLCAFGHLCDAISRSSYDLLTHLFALDFSPFH